MVRVGERARPEMRNLYQAEPPYELSIRQVKLIYKQHGVFVHLTGIRLSPASATTHESAHLLSAQGGSWSRKHCLVPQR